MADELAVVMPVYNEEGCIDEVVGSWLDVLCGLKISFRLLILNDGSLDKTAEILSKYASHRHVTVINKANTGHGPTILQGYRLAVDMAEWVFQADSDNEISPLYFAELWERRELFDALFGFRQNREQGKDRYWVSTIARKAVHFLYGSGVKDVNTPYRLMKSAFLKPILAAIPADTFAPNVIISGYLHRCLARIYNHPVEHRNRRTGVGSLISWKLWKAASISLLQVLYSRLKFSRQRHCINR